MKLLNRVLQVTGVLVLVVGSTVLVAQKGGGKPAPPPSAVPLALADGFNIVTREIFGTAPIRAWHSSSSGGYAVGWEEFDRNVPYVALGDVDGADLGDGRKDYELVMPVAYSVGTKRQPRYSVCLWAYKQGQSGPYYTTPCTGAEPVSEVNVTSSQMSVTPYDLDRDGTDEVVLATPSKVAVYELTTSERSFHKVAEVNVSALVLPGESKGPQRHSLAVGDIDADGDPEIVCGGVIYSANANGDEHSYVLAYNEDLELEGYYHVTGSGDLSSFVIEQAHGLQIGETAADGAVELWCAGWTNTAVPSTFDQHVRSWRVTGTGGGGPLPVQAGPSLDFMGVSVLGPTISLGRLFDATGPEQVVLTRLNDRSRVDVYSTNCDSGGCRLHLAASTTVPGVALHQAFVVGSQLFLGGTVTGSKTTPSGVYVGVFEPEAQTGGSFDLRHLWSNGDRTGREMWTYTVGYGNKR